MYSRLEESGVRARPGTSGMGGTLPRGDRSVLRPRLNWEGGVHGTTKTGTTRGAASSGSDQAHEQARSGGRIRHTTEDGTLRLIEKASICRQMMGHRR